MTTLLAALSLVVQVCASPGKEITQTVRVETPGCAQVSCELSNDLGTWSLARTPGAVTVTTSHQALTVSCRAEYGGLGSGSLPSALKSTSGAGAAAGGVGHLGLDFDRGEQESSGRLKIAGIITLGPAALTPDIHVGDYLLAV
ncbi:MAG TPA: hypothetical protein VMS92_03450, partial [Mycobacterium sp.]|nr:hypothetical protein [Mycobacterium sp.]